MPLNGQKIGSIWAKRTKMDIMQNGVIFLTSELEYTNLKTGPNKSKIM